jgi:hypothetical protein
MAVAQVSLRSAVKAPVARAARNTKRTTRAAKVVAKAGMERVEVAKKVAPVALSVGASSPPSPKPRESSEIVIGTFPTRAARSLARVRSRPRPRGARRPIRPSRG